MSTTERRKKTIRMCPRCGDKIRPDESHVHRESCVVCSRPIPFCSCGNTPRPKINSAEWPGLKSIVTICPVQYAAEGRQIAAAFLNNGEPADVMLNVAVAAGGATEVTHVMCERYAYPDEVQRQQEYWQFIGLPWVSGRIHQLSEGIVDQFAIYLKEDEDTFAALGLEEL